MLLMKKFKVQIPLSIIELLKNKNKNKKTSFIIVTITIVNQRDWHNLMSLWLKFYIYIYILIGKLHTHQMSLELIILSSIEHLQGKDVWFEQEYIRGLQYSPNLICIHWLLYHDLHSKSFVVKCNT